MADLFRKVKSLYASTTNTFGTGTGVTITPNSVSGLPTDTEITLTFDRVDATGAETPNAMERIIGTISGGNFVVRTSPSSGRGADGSTEQAHTAPVVEFIVTANDYNDVIDGILAQHNQAGAHSDVTATSIQLGGSGVVATGILDEDDMTSNSAVKLASQQSIKAYVDAATPSSLTVTAAPGSDHTSSGLKITLTANENQAFGDVCYINADGEAQLVDADAIATGKALVMAIATISADASGEYLLMGIARDDTWNWTVGGHVFITVTGTSGNTLSQTAPSGADDVVKAVGIATHADRLYFAPAIGGEVEHTG